MVHDPPGGDIIDLLEQLIE